VKRQRARLTGVARELLYAGLRKHLVERGEVRR